MSGPGPAGPDTPGRPRRRRLLRDWGWFVGLVLAFGIGLSAQLITLPYAVMMPGPPTDVLGVHPTGGGASTPRIQISGAPTYETTGSLEFTTVRVSGGPGNRVTVIDLVRAWVLPDEDIYPIDDIFPPEATQQQIAEESRAEMVGSQQEAAAVALRALGQPVEQQVKVASVAADAPSGDVLKAGDTLVSVAGRPVTDGESVRSAVSSSPAGQTVEIVVLRDGTRQTLQARTGSNADGRTVLGIILRREYQLPFAVTIDAGNVGGPSAGLMFALGVYDKLTPGALTGGRTIAGTGTIDDAGRVGPIGGIAQKIAGARAAGVTHFLAPAGNCDEVVGRESGLTVVRVATFDEARHAVEQIAAGRDADLPRCTR